MRAMISGVILAIAVPAIAAIEKPPALYDFDYNYPPQVRALPKLRGLLDREATQAKADLIAEATEARADAAKGDFPYNTYSYSADWSVVADTPRFLSLSAALYSYSGGAHGMPAWDSIVWDRTAAVRIAPVAFFTGKAALGKLIRKDFCAAIDWQRAEKRGEPAKPGSKEMFDECIDSMGNVLLLGSRNRRTFDRIGIIVGPYNAGPYSEGVYEVTLPVTPAIRALVKPTYRAYFSVGR